LQMLGRCPTTKLHPQTMNYIIIKRYTEAEVSAGSCCLPSPSCGG
jgi:hypothetical protein